MGRRKRELQRRADNFATGRVTGGDSHISERGALAYAWERGYRAAVSDVRTLTKRAGGSAHHPTLAAVIHEFTKPRR